MNLLKQVEHLWSKEAETKAAGWAVKLRDAKKSIQSAKQQFHEWYPLKVYLCYSDAIERNIKFSLRYLGQEVATLQAGANDVSISIPPKTAAVNTRFCGIGLTGKYPWRASESQAFRKHFRSLEHREYHDSVHSEEHHIESEFLRHMKDPAGRSKFNGTFRGIQPVTLGGLPFQFPVPISGCKGVPNFTNGNIDILARRGAGKGTRISVWELKRPWELKRRNTTGHAISQAYIYSVTLLKMLRTHQSGDIWYRDIIGFGSKVPDRLVIESVVAVSIADDRNRRAFEDKLRAFKSNNRLSIGNDTIKLYMAHYRKDPLTVEMTEF